MNELDINYTEIEDLDYCIELLNKKDKEIERLNNIRNKAIQYIENNYYNSKLNIYASASSKEVKELLKILRGDKE